MAEQPEDKEARITLPISASSALLAMGFGLWWAWTDSFYLASPGASPSATSMIPSERCFISLGCGLALIALLLKQKRQKERIPRGIVWASALCMSMLPFIARVISLYTEESSWRVLLLLVAGFASAALPRVAVENRQHLGRAITYCSSRPRCRCCGQRLGILARRHPTFCEILCTSTCFAPCLSCRLCKNEANFLWQQTLCPNHCERVCTPRRNSLDLARRIASIRV